jgi:hypothetical protein
MLELIRLHGGGLGGGGNVLGGGGGFGMEGLDWRGGDWVSFSSTGASVFSLGV